ncbi:hypothetical protein CesoFtcFv8_000247 [Champsocephalus esox]|uniref:Uncharacterized protein n=1 Tax=Champsocephalus esox TaxID=159716 RepID=A0AAN8DVY4_9TELE|nr:hypothetical protein CesoFtcFv8_000247 [Champsocephalus esox]
MSRPSGKTCLCSYPSAGRPTRSPRCLYPPARVPRPLITDPPPRVPRSDFCSPTPHHLGQANGRKTNT